MSFQVALRLAAFFLGAFLHGILVFGVLGRRQKRPSERVLRLFFAALFAWHAGSFLGLALQGAAGPGASLQRRLANTAAFAGLAFLPSLLLHAVVSEGRERRGLPATPRGERAAVVAAYLPLLGLPVPLALILRPPEAPPLVRLAPLVVPWTAWFVLVLLAAAGFSLRIGRLTSRDARRLDLRLALSFLVAALGLAYAYLLDGRSGPWGYMVETAVMASSILPTLVFVYHVYRYQVLGYVVRDSAVSLLASASFVALYLLVVREAARRAERVAGIPAAFLEGAVLLILVLLFEPYGDTLRALARRYLAGGREKLHRQAALAASLLTRTLSVGEIAEALRSTLEESDLIAGATLLVAEDLPIGSPEVRRLEEVCPAVGAELGSGRARLLRDDPGSAAAAAELERLGAHAALPLRTRGRLHGALLLSGRGRRGLLREDLEALEAVAQGAALALAAAALLHEKLGAERQAAHAEKMASLGWLAAAVAHEVKNPLSSIKAVAQVLRDEVGDEHRFRPDLELIVREADRLDGAVERLLATARPEREAQTRVDLRAALDRMAIALGPQARARGVAFEIHLRPGASRVRASSEGLWEVFYNLAVNAIDAMPSGGVFRIDQVDGVEADRVRLRLGDQGPGIDPAVAGRVFEPFFTTKEHGHGLGLAIVKRRLHEMGGDIALLEGDGAGATFEITLRAAP